MHNSQYSDGPSGHGSRFHHAPFGRGGAKSPFGMAAHLHGFGHPGSVRARRGDVRSAILRLLAEAPMHGYQIIQELSARSDGAWTPSAGSVYPALQMLADEGLVFSEETSGKKVFTLTETGAAEVARTADQPAPWDDAAQSDSGIGDYRESAAKLLQAAFQIGKSGTSDQRAAAAEILNDARKKLYAVLAEG